MNDIEILNRIQALELTFQALSSRISNLEVSDRGHIAPSSPYDNFVYEVWDRFDVNSDTVSKILGLIQEHGGSWEISGSDGVWPAS